MKSSKILCIKELANNIQHILMSNTGELNIKIVIHGNKFSHGVPIKNPILQNQKNQKFKKSERNSNKRFVLYINIHSGYVKIICNE